MRWIIVLTAALLLSGCGYRATGYDGLYRDDVRTVAVPAVAVGTDYEPGLADAVAAAVVREIEARTPYRVADAGRADTLLEVRLVRVGRDATIRSFRTGLNQEQRLLARAEVTWTDLRDGRELLAVENLRQGGRYYPSLGEGEFAGEQAVAQQLAAAVVDEMSRRW